MNLKTAAAWAVLAFVIWWVIVAPSSAHQVVYSIGVFLTTTAHGISHFFTSV